MNSGEIVLIKKALSLIEKISKYALIAPDLGLKEAIDETQTLVSSEFWDLQHLQEDVEKYPGLGTREMINKDEFKICKDSVLTPCRGTFAIAEEGESVGRGATGSC